MKALARAKLAIAIQVRFDVMSRSRRLAATDGPHRLFTRLRRPDLQAVAVRQRKQASAIECTEVAMAISRKAFLVQLLPTASAGWVLGGCGGGGGGDAMPSSGQCSAAIAGNHGHALSVPRADLDSTTDRSYDIQGSAVHTHMVTFTAAQLAMLKAGQAVSVTSTPFSGDGHTHLVTESC
jgi:hypothetical protein